MLLHFIRRDFLDHRPHWGLLAAVTALYAVALPFFSGARTFGTQLLGVVYVMFALSGENSVMGTVWRSQYHLSRHYLLALPIAHKKLFVLQHLRIGAFWLPVLIAGTVGPLVWEQLARTLTLRLYVFHVFALLTSVGLLIESTMWMTLEMERLSRYVPSGRRLWTWVRAQVVTCAAMAFLGLGWFGLLAWGLVGAPPLSALTTAALLAAIPPRIIFPVALVWAILWMRRNASRWCVTL
jgi:hypothetical protein